MKEAARSERPASCPFSRIDSKEKDEEPPDWNESTSRWVGEEDLESGGGLWEYPPEGREDEETKVFEARKEPQAASPRGPLTTSPGLWGED